MRNVIDNRYDRQRGQFQLALAEITDSAPTGPDWDEFRDEYVAMVRLTDDADTPTFDKVWNDTLLVARNALRVWGGYSYGKWEVM
jgi:hypothetical protein